MVKELSVDWNIWQTVALDAMVIVHEGEGGMSEVKADGMSEVSGAFHETI